MKKKLIISVCAIFAALLALFSANYLLSFHKVAFDLDDSVTKITLYTADDTQISTLTSSDHTLLREGKYYVIPEGEKIATDKIPFTVEKKDITISIQPGYTKDFLSSSLKEELPAIETAIAKKYPSLSPQYTLANSTLYQKGEWFGGLLAPKVSDSRDIRDPYRIILHKKDGEWQVVRRPEYTLSASRYKEVPTTVLRAVNAIVP